MTADRLGQKKLEEMTGALQQMEPELDQLAKARVRNSLRAAIAAESAHGAQHGVADLPPSALRRWLPALAAAVVLLATGISLWMATKDAPDAASTRGATAAMKLIPTALSGNWGTSARPSVGMDLGRVTVPPGAALSAQIGEADRLMLQGPASLSVRTPRENTMELSLRRGRVLVAFEAGRGRRLLIRSPGSVTEVTGTLFAVEVNTDQKQSTVAVLRGQVRVDSGKEAFFLKGGEMWRGDKSEPVSAALREALRAHDRGLLVTRTPMADGTLSPPRPKAAVSSRPIAQRQDKHPRRTRPTAKGLYSLAEEAMRKRNNQQAEERLRELANRYPQHRLAQVALYELALAHFRRDDVKGAGELLAQAGTRGTQLGEPARYLQCRIDFKEKKTAAARDCFRRFSRRFPRSAHAEEVHWLIAALDYRIRACKALPALRHYLTRYPKGKYAKAAQERIDRCQQAATGGV